jgi:excinuclease ABC subunit B
LVPDQRKKLISALENEMLEHAKNLEFEQAAAIRDEIEKVKNLGAPPKAREASKRSGRTRQRR